MKIYLTRAIRMGMSYRMVFFIISLSLVTIITEIFGIGMFLPIFQFIRLEGDLNALVESSGLWQHVIDGFIFFGVEASLVALLVLSFTFFMSRQIFVYLRLIYNSAISQRLIQLQRNRMFSRYLKADISYYDKVSVGNFVNIITTEVNNAVMGVTSPIELVVYVIMLVGYLTMLLFLSWEMTVASMVVLLIASQVPRKWIKKSAQTGRKLVNANTLMSGFLVGRLRSPRLVRLSGTENAEKNEFLKLTQEQRKHTVFSAILRAKTEVSMEPVVIAMSMIFLYISYTVLQLQIEVIGLYLVVALRLMPIVKGIVSQWQSVQYYAGAIEAIEERLHAMQESTENDTGLVVLNKLERSIEFDNVSYRYPLAKSDALKNINIKIKVNEMIALVGPSGSGKSTLIDLLPRLRQPKEGFIKIDGVNIEKNTLKSIRELIAYVPQSPQIFNGTVEAHIRYGKGDATDEEVQKSAHLAGAKEFIDQLSEGFDTVLGEDAIRLSGGQRQRLDLARALVKKVPILILDEPTSNLDVESEERLKSVLEKIRNDTDITIIIVTHRLASVVDFDKIIVLNKGLVESVGGHSKLLKERGWYGNAWRAQEADK